ncbi:MAG: trypsin-like peptidase domain-containing protein [Dehalococcoidia bacterium]|nr:trypsin-like peptidase domain-containing protein [Dehalococcoidia bacterium]
MTTAAAVFGGALAEEGAALATHLRSVAALVRSRAGGGSGTVWSSDGLIVTNSHVVPGDRAEVVLAGERVLPARVVSRDAGADLAALRIEATGLPAAKPADSDAVRPGQLVFAIGNPWGARDILTAGVVVGRGPGGLENAVPLDDAIRADVQLAPGNSGGPLVDAAGRVVGVNAMIAGGMAVAVPSNTVERFLAGGLAGDAELGISGRAVPLPPPVAASFGAADGAGLMVTDVQPGGAAAHAGLLPGDVIVRVDRVPGGATQVARRLGRLRAGRPVHLEFLRGWATREADAEPTIRS